MAQSTYLFAGRRGEDVLARRHRNCYVFADHEQMPTRPHRAECAKQTQFGPTAMRDKSFAGLDLGRHWIQ